jgi:hypothetical protein
MAVNNLIVQPSNAIATENERRKERQRQGIHKQEKMEYI